MNRKKEKDEENDSCCVIETFSLRDNISDENEMFLAERIQIPFSEHLSKICQLAKELWNKAIFIGRQLYFLRTRKNYDNLKNNFSKYAKKILDFMETELDDPILTDELKDKICNNTRLEISDELKNKLYILEIYEYLDKFLKFEKSYNKLSDIYSPLPQQVLMYVAESWKSYYKAHKVWNTNPELFEVEPKIPSFNRKKKEFLLSFSGMYFNNEKYAKTTVQHYDDTKKSKTITNKKGIMIKTTNTGELKFPSKFLKNFPSSDPFPTIRTTTDIKSIIEIRIVPKKSYFEIQVIRKVSKIINPYLDDKKANNIDIGVNTLIALTNNFGEQTILIRGRKIKSINQWMNKKISDLRRKQTQGMIFKKGQSIPETQEITRIRKRRDNVINDYFHKASRFVINQCLKNNVKHLAIGYNSGWKQDLTSTKNKKMSHEKRQTFAYIPFLNLIKMIQYKAELVGINVVRIEESHTSKCSVLDFEEICHHDFYLGQRGVSRTGRNKKKLIKEGESMEKKYNAFGLFRSKDGHIISADVNASYNIGRKAFPNLFNEYTLSREQILRSPVSVQF